VDTLLVIPNEKIFSIIDKKASTKVAYAKANEVLQQAVEGISQIIYEEGIINLDYNDAARIMKGQGVAHIGVGRASGDKRAEPGRALLRNISIGITLLFLGGALHTAKTELLKAPYRRLHYETMLRSVHRIEEMSEEELENLYEYRHGKERILKAFSILKERKLNCFYEK